MGVFRHSFDADGDEAGLFEITGKIIRQSTKAILFDDGASQQWLPKSKIKIREPDARGIVIVLMPEWLVKEKKYV